MVSRCAGPSTASARDCSGVICMALATSPNCRSRSTSTTECGAQAPSPTARLVATVVFPAPPLGEITEITRPFAPPCSGEPANGVSSARRWAVAWTARCSNAVTSAVPASGCSTSRTPARIAASVMSGPDAVTSSTLIPGCSRSRPAANCNASSSGTPGPRMTTSGR